MCWRWKRLSGCRQDRCSVDEKHVYYLCKYKWLIIIYFLKDYKWWLVICQTGYPNKSSPIIVIFYIYSIYLLYIYWQSQTEKSVTVSKYVPTEQLTNCTYYYFTPLKLFKMGLRIFTVTFKIKDNKCRKCNKKVSTFLHFCVSVSVFLEKGAKRNLKKLPHIILMNVSIRG